LVKKKRQIPIDETSAEKPSFKKTEIEVMFFSPGLMETMRAAFKQHQKKKDEGK
jgi:hypothetical protein